MVAQGLCGDVGNMPSIGNQRKFPSEHSANKNSSRQTDQPSPFMKKPLLAQPSGGSRSLTEKITARPAWQLLS